MFSSLWDVMLITTETTGSVTEDTRKERLHRKGGPKGKDRKRKEKRDRGGEKNGERFLSGKGEDVGPLKEDAACRSQLSHLDVNP